MRLRLLAKSRLPSPQSLVFQELLGLAGVVGDGQGRGDDLRGQRVHARLAIVRRDCCRELLGSLNNVSPDFQEELRTL
jgi:hypothetical protein